MDRRARRNLMLGLLLAVAWVGWAMVHGRGDTLISDVGEKPPVAALDLASVTGDPDVVPGSLLVDLADSTREAQVVELASRLGVGFETVSEHSGAGRLYRVHAGGRLAALFAALRGSPLVEAAEPEILYHLLPASSPAEPAPSPAEPAPPPSPAEPPAPGSAGVPVAAQQDRPARGFPNDPRYRYQWHLRQIGMPSAWQVADGGGAVVAVIDTGVAFEDREAFRRVPDLRETRFVPGYNFVARNKFPDDDHGHGTHVAGTVAQSTNNGVGVAGIAYGSRVMPLKVLSARGFGSVGAIADAIRFAVDHGAQVINMSLGGRLPSRVLANAVRYAHAHGVTVVCAAGNDGRGRVSYPAAYPGAIAVAATQFDEQTTFYSNWGREIDVAAPGGNTRVDQNRDGLPDGVLQNTIVAGDPQRSDYLLFMGTSMASPHVAGVAALLVSQGVTRPQAIERVLEKTARVPPSGKRGERYGAGIVDAGAALSRVVLRYGFYQLLCAAALALLVLRSLARRRLLGLRPGLGFTLALVVGSSGLFFLPHLVGWLGGGPLPLGGFYARGFPAWDLALLGPSGHANPVFYSALAPIVLVGLLYGVHRLRGLLCGLTLGIAGHLFFHAFFRLADIRYLPDWPLFEPGYLLANVLVCLAVARIVARK